MKDNSRLISIIIPAYNAESTLNRCVDSIIAQTYGKFELILVNDGSVDRTAEIINDYISKDQRIIGINKSNGGVSSARNAALDIARGEYVIFIDSDDTVDCAHIEEFMNSDCDCIISGINISRLGKNFTEKPEKEEIVTKSQFNTIIDKYSNTTFFRGPYVKAFKRAIIVKYNLKFDERLHWAEDYIFTLNFLSHSETIATRQKASYTYECPITIGKYKLDEEEYRVGLKIILEILSKIGKCNRAENIAKIGYFYTFMSYISRQPFNVRAKNYIKALLNDTIKLPSSLPTYCIKRHLELLRITIFTK